MSAAAMAWACSPQAYIFLSSTGGARWPEDDRERARFHRRAGADRVERRLRSAGGHDSRTRFSTTIRVPANAAPSIAYIHGVARDAAGKACRRCGQSLPSGPFQTRARMSWSPPAVQEKRRPPAASLPLRTVHEKAAPGTRLLDRSSLHHRPPNRDPLSCHWRRDEACAGAIDVDWRRARVSC